MTRRRLIVSNAKVVSSNEKKFFVIEFFLFDDLKQDAIPNTNRVVEKGDILLFKLYVWDQSLLIAPDFNNYKSSKMILHKIILYIQTLFVASLKFQNQPLPRIEDFQKFPIEQNLELFLLY